MMDDSISRQAAIDEIDEWIKAFRENGHKESAADACLIQDGIIQLPPVTPKQRWIPRSERLPEVKQKVLVQYADESMETKRCNDAGHLQWFYSNAVAWMPAPEPWEGEAE